MSEKSVTRFHLALILLVFGVGCNHNNSKQDPFLLNLTEHEVGDTDLFISLPPGYVIKESRGIDFSVYHFVPGDSMIQPPFTAGLYAGNHPHEFEPANDRCSEISQESKVFGSNEDWLVYRCDSSYSAQVIVDHPEGKGWNEEIHAFGRALSESELVKVLQIFSTMRTK